MSKLLKKLLKYSVLPASLMVVGKLLGILLAAQMYSLPLTLIHDSGQIFTVGIFLPDQTQAYVANTVSNAILLSVMNVSTFIIYLKYILYLRTEGNPKTIVKLTKFNVLKWVTDQESGFVKTFVWTFFLLATNAVIMKDAMSQSSFGLLGAISFLSTILYMWGLIRTFELETATIYPRSDSQSYSA